MVRIITDTASDLEKSEYQEKGVMWIPLNIIVGNIDYQETVDLDKETFYRLLTETGEYPKTSQPAPCILVNMLQDLKDKGDEAVCICLSSALSGFYQGALLSKQIAEIEDCYIIDSLTAAAGQRILVEYAVKLRDEGKRAKEIADEIERLKGRVIIYACLDTLDYLYKGGRISGEARMVGTVLGIKPVITLQKGKPVIQSKKRGMRKGILSICELLQQKAPDSDFPIYVMYTHISENGQNLMKELKLAGEPINDENFINVGAAIGSHIGPGGCGIAYVCQEQQA